jgi:hypothetical protein
MYLSGVLRALVQLAGKEEAAEIWRSGRVSLESFMAPELTQEFASENVRPSCLCCGSVEELLFYFIF